MTQVVVADAGPLIGLARIGQLPLLTSLYGAVLVTEAVLTELNIDSGRPGARALSLAVAQGAILPRQLQPGSESELARLCLSVDAGEASAILLARQVDCRFLLIDERRGREIARRRGLQVVGLGGVLLAAKRSRLIHSVEPVLIALAAEGYRLTDALVAEILRLAGEVSPMPVTSRPWS